MIYKVWALDRGEHKCEGCGALVVDKPLHDAFHEGLHSTALQAQQSSVYTNVIGPKPGGWVQ